MIGVGVGAGVDLPLPPPMETATQSRTKYHVNKRRLVHDHALFMVHHPERFTINGLISSSFTFQVYPNDVCIDFQGITSAFPSCQRTSMSGPLEGTPSSAARNNS